MKSDWSHLDSARVKDGNFGSNPGDRFGAFFFTRGQTRIRIIATDGEGEIPWEHVSVTVAYRRGCCSWVERMPTWDEMCWVKGLFWGDDEAVMQLHPPKSDYVNNHRYCLHLWKPTEQPIPLPPSICVGDQSLGVLQ